MTLPGVTGFNLEQLKTLRRRVEHCLPIAVKYDYPIHGLSCSVSLGVRQCQY